MLRSGAHLDEPLADADETHFSPDEPCTRAEIVTFLWRSLYQPGHENESPFRDVAADSFYADAVLWAAETGVTLGTTPTTFSPDFPCTRAQAVTFLHRMQPQR